MKDNVSLLFCQARTEELNVFRVFSFLPLIFHLTPPSGKVFIYPVDKMKKLSLSAGRDPCRGQTGEVLEQQQWSNIAVELSSEESVNVSPYKHRRRLMAMQRGRI